MARKTDGEKIDELIPLVAALREGLGNVREELLFARSRGAENELLRERLDNVREELKELKSDLKESRRMLWLIVPPVLAALLSAALMAAVNYLIRR